MGCDRLQAKHQGKRHVESGESTNQSVSRSMNQSVNRSINKLPQVRFLTTSPLRLPLHIPAPFTGNDILRFPDAGTWWQSEDPLLPLSWWRRSYNDCYRRLCRRLFGPVSVSCLLPLISVTGCSPISQTLSPCWPKPFYLCTPSYPATEAWEQCRSCF